MNSFIFTSATKKAKTPWYKIDIFAKKMVVQKFGFVVGTAMKKTIKVRIENIKMHPIVKKVSHFF
jgi:hypothetical protein